MISHAKAAPAASGAGDGSGVKIPPNFKHLITFKSSESGPVMDMTDAQDSYYQRISD